jgi:Chaperone of endosialidase
MKMQTSPILTALTLLCLAAAGPKAQAVSPAPDGGYPGGNTAEGPNALLSLTTGAYNTAVGLFSLESNTTGKFNTAIGAGTLLANTADGNTATGAGALLSNTSGTVNTANGEFALFNNTTGGANTAIGEAALFLNTVGSDNAATGNNALQNNTQGNNNTANGAAALFSNTTGGGNTAIGQNALTNNSAGSDNTAIGQDAGSNETTGSSNVYIGAGMSGVAGENNACYIASIFGQTSTNGMPILINSNNKLGTTTSSKRFKEEIKPMGKNSEALLALKPVTFRYKRKIDPAGTSQFGLVAEDVEKVNPDLVVRDKEGKPYSVRYDQVNAMLLNEFLKAHRKVQEQEATIAELKSGMKALTETVKDQAAQIQKVCAQVNVSKVAAKTIVDNP